MRAQLKLQLSNAARGLRVDQTQLGSLIIEQVRINDVVLVDLKADAIARLVPGAP